MTRCKMPPLLLAGLFLVAVGCGTVPVGAAGAPPGATPVATHEGSATVSAAAPAEPADARSELEGRYKVGPTTCIIKPVKMAFALKWEKGKGTMHLFYEGTNSDGNQVFVSEDLGGGRRDRFIFDDRQYDTGLFVRADGKTMHVRRLK